MKTNLKEIITTISNYYDIPIDDIKSKKRNSDIVKARHVYFYLSKKLTNNILYKIGNIVNRDHSTVLHGYNMIKWDIKIYKDLQKDIEIIEQNLVSPLVIQKIDLLLMCEKN